MLRQKSEKLIQIFYIVFVATFGWLFFNVIFNNMHFSYSPFVVLPIAGVWLYALYLIYRTIQKHESILVKYKVRYLIAFFVLLVITLFAVYSQLRTYPTRDFERIFTGAYNYTIAGVIEDPYLDYFYKYPNNMPLTIFLQFVFRVFYKFGFTNFYIVGALVNTFCICGTYFFLYLCCEKRLGVKQGFFALALMYLCIPIHFYISVFYTDIISMPFIPFALYISFLIQDAKNAKETILPLAGLFVVIGFGLKIKYSVAIIIIAISIDFIIRKEYKKIVAICLTVLCSFFTWSSGFDAFMYKNILDEEIAYDAATPFASWIMMSLKGDGTHDPNDNYFIWYFETHEEKNEYAWLEIRARLEEHGVLGYIRFLNQKAIRSFGSGNMDMSNTAADSPMKQGFLVECASEFGQYFTSCDNIIQGYHIMLFLSITIGALMAYKKRVAVMFPVYLSIFGLFLFLLLWESGQRYLINYTAMYMFAGTYALMQIFDRFDVMVRKKIQKNEQ